MNKLFIGMDLHKNSSTFCVKDKEGKLYDSSKVVTNPFEVQKYINNFKDSELSLVVEPVSQWYFYADLLEKAGVDIHLANPLKVKAIASTRVKTDKIDAAVLCDLLRGNLLPEAYFSSKEVRKKSLQLPEQFQISLEKYIDLVAYLDQLISEADKNIEFTVSDNQQANLLTSIPGVSYVSALTIIAEIGDINRFPSSKKLQGYAGLVPSTYASGESVRHGRITKQGSRWLRWTMIEIAHRQILCKKNPGLGWYYLKLRQRRGSGTAAVATARKLLAVIYRLLKDNRPFESRVGSLGCLPNKFRL